MVKISRLVGIIAKRQHFVPQNTLLRIYQSLILPYISYRLTAWGLASVSYLMKILVLQKRTLKFIFSVERCEHAVPLFTHANILPKFLRSTKNAFIMQSKSTFLDGILAPRKILQGLWPRFHFLSITLTHIP